MSGKDELDGVNEGALTEEELAMMNGDDDVDDATAAANTDDNDQDQGSDPDDNKEGDDDESELGSGTGDAEENGTGQTDAETGGDDEPEEVAETPDQQADNQPVYHAELSDDFDDKLTALDEKEDALDAKLEKAQDDYMEGELDDEQLKALRDEVRQSRRELRGERSTLDAQRVKAELAAEMQQQQHARAWHESVNGFFEQVKQAGGVDYAGNGIARSALDEQVRELAEKPENADKDAQWFLATAHNNVLQAFGQGAATKPVKTPSKKPVIPPTLGDVPTASGNDTGEDEFAHLDKLKGVEAEAAVARLSDEAQERYFAGR